ncbi:MAG: exopolysaccharide biosynthesis polyprenyl glycosylphosphotransferase [Methyloceanibacter sp.]|uniref:exopolysaccharide biosynthesis polyprenyl glycosylphosphotransferase n=1 Tax=Methyloceanibacter sp. TaxID=1965321 RepID=UPI003D6D2435
MAEITQFAPGNKVGPARNIPLILGRALALVWPVADALVVVVLAVLAGVAYHLAAYDGPGSVVDYAKVGAAVALFRWILQHPVSTISARPKGSLRYQFYLWNAAFLCLLAFGFLGKISGTYSRGTVLLFYLSGLPLLVLWQEVWKRFVRQGLHTGKLAVRHGLLLGTLAKVDEFRRKYRPGQSGMIVSDTVILPEEGLDDSPHGSAVLNEALGRAIDLVRRSHLDDVVVLLPWSATHAVNACADRLMTIPVSVQLGPEAIFDRFSHVHLSRLGPATMLNLIRPPLTRIEILSKRLFDFCASLALLIAVSPLLLVVALLIKLDSPGPVFFRQWRHGFNQRPFRILKFRTMTVAEDGDVVTQAVKNDPRVTRIGRFLRRWNIDELPQLLNVVTGDMSLVGPRPHALTHDRDYERRIAFYARRHNIKPGITGWAQVNGLRGITDTDEKMQARVEHDLYYIDNWSIPLDLYILALTALSPKSFRNAH